MDQGNTECWGFDKLTLLRNQADVPMRIVKARSLMPRVLALTSRPASYANAQCPAAAMDDTTKTATRPPRLLSPDTAEIPSSSPNVPI
ncbi:hypothetical protein EsDP_00005578 [Epichloe bromicola]|uniref:Uncharacterized protein n=1 Tax=Epichloe bromicola TaxID=79588 RepID=A0ABQ0CV50_9HYPO